MYPLHLKSHPRQQGEEAISAKNVFHPLTYEGAVDIDSIEDKVQKEATIAQISSYGNASL